MNLLFYIHILKLNKSKIASLRGKDFIRLQNKLNLKSIYIPKINKVDGIEFIKILKNNQKEISSFLDPSFFVLRTIIESPKEFTLYEPKKSINRFETERMKQFVQLNYSRQIETYVDLCIENNNLRALHSLMYYWFVISDSIKETIRNYLTDNLKEGLNILKNELNFTNEFREIIHNPFLFRCLNTFQTSEIDSNITEIQKILSTQLLNQDNSFDNISLAFAVSFYESKDAEVKKALEYLKQRAEDKGIFESLLKNKNPKGGSSKKRELTVRKETRSRSYSAGAAGISIAAIGTAITIIRGLYALLGPSNSTDYSNNYYQEQQVNYRTPDFEIRNIQKDLIFKQSIGETTNNQPLEFNRSNVEFVSDLAKYPFPGPHTVIKNETQKNIVFFYNTHFGGFRYKLVYPETSDTVIFRYQYFLIYRGKNPCNGSYTSNNKIKNVGFLFNDFDESDKKLLNTLYINKSQKLRKQSVIFIYGDSVLISEKS